MNREERAKQFAPFEALAGLRQALREKEIKHEVEQKRELSEERVGEIAQVIATLDKGDKVLVKCFESGYYVTILGAITKIDLIKKFLVLGDGKILFSNIYDIRREDVLKFS